MMTFRWVLICALAMTYVGAEAGAQECGTLSSPGQFGPYDYWRDRDKLVVVEQHHFTPVVERLLRGQDGTLGGDIDYTLRAFPNHARALIAMVKLGVRDKTHRPGGASYSIECYFERALRFRPNDGMARMIFANFLSSAGRHAEAVKQLEAAEEVAAGNGNMQYNLGLAYFETKNYEKSLAAAHQAYQLGFDLPGLKGKLVKAGKWRDPPASPPKIASPAETADDTKVELAK